MKTKIPFLIVPLAFLMSCGNSTDSKKDDTAKSDSTKPVVQASTAVDTIDMVSKIVNVPKEEIKFAESDSLLSSYEASDTTKCSFLGSDMPYLNKDGVLGHYVASKKGIGKGDLKAIGTWSYKNKMMTITRDGKTSSYVALYNGKDQELYLVDMATKTIEIYFKTNGFGC